MTERELLVLFEAYHGDIYRFSYSFTGSHHDAEDITQSTFIKLLEKQPRLQAGKEKAWLMQVAANQCRNLLKSSRRRKTEPLEEVQQCSFTSGEEKELFLAVMGLPPKERTAIHLHYFEGYTLDEIARMLRVTSSAVSMRLHRARTHLKQSLKEDGL